MGRIDEELLNTINEEQGVSIELVDKTYDVYNKLVSAIANNKEIKSCDIQGVKYKEGYLEYKDFFGYNIIIEYYFYNFLSKECFKDSFKKVNNICRVKNKSILQITVFAISGGILNEHLLDGLSHELEHIFQYNKANKIFASSNLYNISVNIKQRYPKQSYEYCVADTIYINRKFEQDAYFQSLYIELMNCRLIDSFRETLFGSDIYNALRALKIHLNDIKYFGYIPSIFQNEKYSYKKLVNDCKSAIKNIQWKMARVYNKALNDYREKYITDEKFSYGNKKFV